MATDVVLELAFQCSDLPLTCGRTAPSTMLSVQHTRQESDFWNQHFQTEIVVGTTQPCYLETVNFLASDGVDNATKLRFVVYKAKNLKSNAVEELGSCYCFVEDLVQEQREFTFHLQNSGDFAGCLHIAVLRHNVEQQQVKKNKSGKTIVPVDESLAESVKSDIDRVRQVGSLKFYPTLQAMYVLDKVTSSTYRFPLQGDQTYFRAQEMMVETRLSYFIPRLFLQTCIKEEEKKKASLEALGKLPPRWDAIRNRKVSVHVTYLERYKSRLLFLNRRYGAPHFKKSTDKMLEDLDFVATNLHLQQLRVENVSPPASPSRVTSQSSPSHHVESTSGSKAWSEYSFITVGAATTHSMGYKQGGLLAQLLGKDETMKGKKSVPVNPLRRCLNHSRSVTDDEQLLLNITSLREQIKYQIEKLRILIESTCSKSLSEDNFSEIEAQSSQSLASLSEKVCKLVVLCDSGPVSTHVVDLATSRPTYKPLREDISSYPSTSGEINLLNGADVALTSANGVVHPNSTHESWKKKNISINSTLSKVVKCVHCITTPDEEAVFLKGRAPVAAQHQELNEELKALQTEVDSVTDEAASGIIFAKLKLENNDVDPELQYRRNAVFSQALSLCISGVCTLISSSLHDQLILHQFSEVGIFLQVESLLSTYGNEQGMLQDYAVGISDLSNVTFKCVKASVRSAKSSSTTSGGAKERYFPSLYGNLDALTVELPFDDDSFELLSETLQRGKFIKIFPVLFNIGINQEQTLAEKFGDTSLQENLNMEAMQRTLEYYDMVRDRCPESIAERLRNANSFVKELAKEKNSSPDRKKAPPGGINSTDVQRPIMDLMGSLSAAVRSKKSKNTEVLQLAADICRRMNGVRVISCKSAKDRTAMAVTLEQARILVNDHGMAQHVFTQALSCMRSQGTRRENTAKNTGSKKYAFTSMQLLTFPKLYRAPDGTFGKGET